MKNKLVGKNVVIFTVTKFFSGRVTRVTKSWIVLEQAAWIPDLGRHADAMRTGKFSEVEPYPAGVRVRVSRGGVIDLVEMPRTFLLPRDQK